MSEDVLRRYAVDLEGVDRGLQVFGPFDQARNARRIAVQSPPQALDARKLRPERLQIA